jgi:hypothetical protein
MMKIGLEFFSCRAWWVALLMLGAASVLRAADYEPLVYRDTSSNSLPYRLLKPLNKSIRWWSFSTAPASAAPITNVS